MAGPSRPVITLNKAMTHTQVYILSRLTVSRDHTRKQIYPNKTSPHPPPQDINISATWLLHQRSLISNPPPPPRPLPSDDNRLERLDPKGCPPLGRKSHPSYRTGAGKRLCGRATTRREQCWHTVNDDRKKAKGSSLLFWPALFG